MTRTLIMGANGFIGTAAVPASTRLGPVCAVVRSATGQFGDLAEPVLWDETPSGLIDIFAEFRPDRVLHLAGVYAREHRPEDIAFLVRGIVELTAVVMEAAIRTTAPTVVLATSAFMHYERHHRPLNLYAATRLAALELAEYYGDAHRARWAALSFYDVYGPGDRRGKMVEIAIRAALEGRPLSLAAEDPEMGLLYVDDAVAALHAAADAVDDGAAPSGSEFFAIPERFHRVSELVATIEAAVGRRIPIDDEPYVLPPRAILTPFKGAPPPGWAPKVALEEGIAKSVAAAHR